MHVTHTNCHPHQSVAQCPLPTVFTRVEASPPALSQVGDKIDAVSLPCDTPRAFQPRGPGRNALAFPFSPETHPGSNRVSSATDTANPVVSSPPAQPRPLPPACLSRREGNGATHKSIRPPHFLPTIQCHRRGDHVDLLAPRLHGCIQRAHGGLWNQF